MDKVQTPVFRPNLALFMPSLRLRIPPLIVFLVAGLLMWLVARGTPALGYAFRGRGIVAAVMAGLGFVVAALGVFEFVRARTTVHPSHPERASAVVTTGIYRATRNPMYLGLIVALAGWGVYLANPLPLIVLPAFVAYMNRFQIEPEEAALHARFGDTFDEYRRRVRRWL